MDHQKQLTKKHIKNNIKFHPKLFKKSKPNNESNF